MHTNQATELNYQIKGNDEHWPKRICRQLSYGNLLRLTIRQIYIVKGT